eukprot:TRINITY_DN34166_c0_g1_i1.p1 TRINITY_DN34166_c0_g1~~TRINITY_DN34166_c0_g1_i1.p1  ORF type:complete len:426 (+),score=67.32 TRINITY_DN34166_c0_g1_i1:107-1384(+)
MSTNRRREPDQRRGLCRGLYSSKPSYLIFLLQCQCALAWGPLGHERIFRVAEALLFGKHKDQLRTMMHTDLVDMSAWEEHMTQTQPATATLHWHRQEPEWTCGGEGGLGDKTGHVKCDAHGTQNGSLFCALAYFFDHFAHDALLQEYPEPKEPIGTPKQLEELKKIPAKFQGQDFYLRWLAILVGDLHQPLHWLSEHAYGKSITVRYNDADHDLLTFWEEFIPKAVAEKKIGMHPDKTDKDYADHAKEWSEKRPTELFRDWARVVAEKLCTEVYAPMTVNHKDGRRIDSPFVLSQELFQKWVDLAEDLMNVGGERLAFVLNEIIEHKRHKDASKNGRGLPSRRSAVGTEQAPPWVVNPSSGGANTEGLEAFYKQLKIQERSLARANAMYNLMIAVVVVPGLVSLFSWHARVGVNFKMNLATHLKT